MRPERLERRESLGEEDTPKCHADALQVWSAAQRQRRSMRTLLAGALAKVRRGVRVCVATADHARGLSGGPGMVFILPFNVAWLIIGFHFTFTNAQKALAPSTISRTNYLTYQAVKKNRSNSHYFYTPGIVFENTKCLR